MVAKHRCSTSAVSCKLCREGGKRIKLNLKPSLGFFAAFFVPHILSRGLTIAHCSPGSAALILFPMHRESTATTSTADESDIDVRDAWLETQRNLGDKLGGCIFGDPLCDERTSTSRGSYLKKLQTKLLCGRGGHILGAVDCWSDEVSRGWNDAVFLANFHQETPLVYIVESRALWLHVSWIGACCTHHVCSSWSEQGAPMTPMKNA
jgi:hypothetical protein